MANNESNNYLYITEENFLENIDLLMRVIRNSPEYQKLADCTQMIFDNKGNKKVNNRQTHTEMVSKLAFELAKKIGLSKNEQELAKLIGVCHDLGHTAFGHNGESRIDKILKYFGISAIEFNNAYATRSNLPELIIDEEYEECEYAFEHHAHSRRVLRKILKDNNIIIEEDLLKDLEWGILCHSESRTPNNKVTKKLWTLARYADKFYAFTDILDTMKSENYIPGDILYRIKEEGTEGKYFSDKNAKEDKEFKLDSSDLEEFSAMLEVFDQYGIAYFMKKYIGEARIIEEDGYFYIDTDTEIGRLMRIFQGVTKYMREKGFIGKEEQLADAMIDEIVAYRIAHPRDGVDNEKDKVIDACLFVSMATDTELRDFYRVISHDEEWRKYFDKKVQDNPEFETIIDQEDRDYIRKNPDMILNYYFNTEIEKVSNEEIKTKLYDELVKYRRKPTLKGRRRLIDLIEKAQVGADPFSIER